MTTSPVTPPSASAAPASSSAAPPGASSAPALTAPVADTPPPVDKLEAEAGAETTTVNAAEAPRGNRTDAQLPLSELLSRASAARRAGDVARARTLLDRALIVSPGNVEAYSTLGDLARAGGDLAGAKANYAYALATSPRYSPALLGLADTEWDQGDRVSAQRHYRALVSSASAPPERAKTRATGAAPTTAISGSPMGR